MPIEFSCPGCAKLLRTPDESAGKKAKCPQCGTISDVPLASTTGNLGTPPQAPWPPVPPAPLGSTPSGPFAGKTGGFPQAQAAAPNPYATPNPDDAVHSAMGARGALVQTKVSFDGVFQQVWAIFRPRMSELAIFGLVLAGANIALQVIGQLGGMAAQASNEVAIVIGFQLVNWVLSMLVQSWLNVGGAIYSLKFARGESASLNDLGRAGPYLFPMIGFQFLMFLAGFGLIVVGALPGGLLYLVTQSQEVAVVVSILGVAVAMVPLFILVYRWILSLYFVVDCGQGVIEAMQSSTRFMQGNKFTVFLILLVVGSAGTMFSLITCCLGYVLFLPYMQVVMAAIYLSATGQPWGVPAGPPAAVSSVGASPFGGNPS